jgi:hypothetical protein
LLFCHPETLSNAKAAFSVQMADVNPRAAQLHACRKIFSWDACGWNACQPPHDAVPSYLCASTHRVDVEAEAGELPEVARAALGGVVGHKHQLLAL